MHFPFFRSAVLPSPLSLALLYSRWLRCSIAPLYTLLIRFSAFDAWHRAMCCCIKRIPIALNTNSEAHSRYWRVDDRRYTYTLPNKRRKSLHIPVCMCVPFV
uniref:Putative secreted peptide n=1 Tax=Anopheles braziliensis TaxID=58242 RepID=A0A2M3ZSQ9_9DIPT